MAVDAFFAAGATGCATTTGAGSALALLAAGAAAADIAGAGVTAGAVVPPATSCPNINVDRAGPPAKCPAKARRRQLSFLLRNRPILLFGFLH